MKNFTTFFCSLALLCSLANGQSPSPSRIASGQQLNEWVIHSPALSPHTREALVQAKTIVPASNSVSSSAPGVTVTPVQIGRASNGFSIMSQETNQVWADNHLNMVGFIHRQDVTIFGGGGAENGKFRYDLSLDDGATWTTDIGVLNAAYTRYGRYPSMTGWNPTGSSNPFNSYFVWGGPTLQPLPGIWTGHTYGVSPISSTSPTSSTEGYYFNGRESLIPGGLTQGLVGEFWTVDFQYDGAKIQDSLYIYKGSWNTAANDVDWIRYAAIDPGHDRSYDGDVRAIGPNVAFSPNGTIGWVGWIGDLAGQGSGQFTNAACFLKSTDGGATWGTPMEVNLDTIPWIQDSLTSFWTVYDSVTGQTQPAGSGIPTAGFDYDLTVDSLGNPHLAVVIANAHTAPGYSLSAGLEKFLLDITTANCGLSWEPIYVATILAFRGEHGTPGPSGDILIWDNCVQTSRTESGSHVFYSWVDTDSVTYGFGNSDNMSPDLRYSGLQIQTGHRAPVIKLTDATPMPGNRILFPTLAPTVLEPNPGCYKLPIVYLDMITNDWVNPCQFWYLGNDAIVGNAWFTNSWNFSYTGFVDAVNRPSTPCLPLIGITEPAPDEVFSLSAHPNPAKTQVTFHFTLSQPGEVRLMLINMMGTVVLSELYTFPQSGPVDLPLSLQSFASGVYLAQLRGEGATQWARLVIEK